MRRFEEQVRRGIECLDRHQPGWREIINLKRLKLSSCMDCVLGQLTGNWLSEKSRELLWNLPGDRDQYGFPKASAEYGFTLQQQDDDEAWGELTAEWVRQLSNP